MKAPTNDKLAQTIEDIDSKHATSGLNKSELFELLAQIDPDHELLEFAPKVDDADEESEAAPEDSAPEPDEYVVCEGKSITSRRGILTPGHEVKAEWLNGGDASLVYLLQSRAIRKA